MSTVKQSYLDEKNVVSQLPRADIGEGPWWDAKGQNLLTVDLYGEAIHRLNLQTGKHDVINTGLMTGFAVLDQNDNVIAGLKDGIYKLQFGSAQKELLCRVPTVSDGDWHVNDGGCDRQGRIWAGTRMLNRKPEGSLYCLDSDGQLTEMVKGVRTSNGMGWSPDNKVMYYTDTQTWKIYSFDYDAKTGKVSNGPRVFAEIPQEDGRPDGLTVDKAGRVYSALFTGGRVNVYTPDGKLEEVISVPALKTTSVAFGGPDMKTLFITSGARDLTEDELRERPLSGRTFAVKRDVAGPPEARFNNTIDAAPRKAKRPSPKSSWQPLRIDM